MSDVPAEAVEVVVRVFFRAKFDVNRRYQTRLASLDRLCRDSKKACRTCGGAFRNTTLLWRNPGLNYGFPGLIPNRSRIAGSRLSQRVIFYGY